MSGAHDFSLQSYAETLHAYVAAGYAVSSFENYLDAPRERHLILRNLDWAHRQRTIFETALGRPIRGLSLHEPARMGGASFADELVREWGLRYHAYEERFMSPSMKYLSDSSGRWREGHFGSWVGREPLMHVLTHPFWWYERVPAENY